MHPLFEQTLPAEWPAYHIYMEAVRTCLDKHPIPIRQRQTLVLILEELLSNILKYSHLTPAHPPIRIRILKEKHRLHLLIEDSGPPFDPTQPPSSANALPLTQKQIGGLGLHLVHHMAQSLTYTRTAKLNRIEAWL